MAEIASPLFFDRYELKYVIPFELVEPISRKVEEYCIMDPYSEKSQDKFYIINSLYFDSPNFRLLRTKLNGWASDRFNMRVRSYGDDPKPPYFMEVKKKVLGFVKKTRGRVNDDNWSKLLLECPLFDERYEQHKNIDLFVQLAISYNITPQVFTQYRRKAYLSIYDDYARVTFDRDLRYMRQTEYSLHPQEKYLTYYDHDETFDGREGNVILELKSPPQMPLWMMDLIRRFDLQRVGFSKYASAMLEVLRQEQRFNFARTSKIV